MRPGFGTTNVPSVHVTDTVCDQAGGCGESVAPALWVSQNGVLITGTTTVSGNGDGHSIRADGCRLRPSAFVQVFLEGAIDSSGNGHLMPSFQASFTIASNPATTRALSALHLSPTGTDVPLNTVVEVEISEAVHGPAATVTVDTDACVQPDGFQVIIPTTRTLRAKQAHHPDRCRPHR